MRAILAERIRQACGYRFPRVGLRAFRAVLSALPPEVETELFPGIHMTLNLRDSTQAATYWQGERFESPTSQIFTRWVGQGGAMFFDIGSNYGFFSYCLLSKFPELGVNAFEPNPKTFALVQSIKERNHLDRMRVWNMGLGDQEARLTLHPGETDSGHSTFGQHPELTAALGEIQVLPFDVWRARQNLPLPAQPRWIAKIDVEGFELNVLRGMTEALSARAFLGLSVEINENTLKFCGASGEEIFALLNQHGYRLMDRQVGAGAPIENAFFVPA